MIRNALLALTAGGLLLANYALRPDPAKRNFDVLPDMARAVSYQSFSANPNFGDGKTLREPVPGTILYQWRPTDERANPIAPTDARALARGEAVFRNFCQVCHGPAGKGDGAVAQRGFPAPPSLLAPKARGMTDGQIFHVITFGQNNMPSYASQVDVDDRWRVVLFIRLLQRREK